LFSPAASGDTAKFSVATSFRDVALEWIAKCEREGRAEVTIDKIRWLLGMAYPLIGSHPINAITPTEALAVLRKVETKGRYESARRMRSVLSRVFRYGIATARCDRDVAADLRGALTTPRTSHHAAITDPIGVGVLLKSIDDYSGQDVTRMALRLREERAPFVFDKARERVTTLVSRVVRDRVFRRIVLRAYDERCAVTGLKLINGGGRAEVEAAHIRPVEANGPDIVSNGLALSGTAHWMFDRGLIGLDDDLQILVSRQANDQDGIRGIINNRGRLLMPLREADRPHQQFVRWHREHCFKH
jgi:hypothetical protein